MIGGQLLFSVTLLSLYADAFQNFAETENFFFQFGNGRKGLFDVFFNIICRPAKRLFQ